MDFPVYTTKAKLTAEGYMVKTTINHLQIKFNIDFLLRISTSTLTYSQQSVRRDNKLIFNFIFKFVKLFESANLIIIFSVNMIYPNCLLVITY